MRFWWNERRERDTARPRVSGAVSAAKRIYDAPAGLGSASADMGALRHFFAVERAAEVSGPLREKQARREERGLEPRLLRETARAARQTGRTPEQIWSEALRGWLAAYADEPAMRPVTFETRRQAVWREIDAAIAGLRAS
ncbi:MAG: hypothetical protein ACHQ4H_00995 [Ktedonobacterales bacterium]